MEGDEGAALIALRELRALVDLEIVRRPVGGKRRDWRLEFFAVADLLAAVAAILRRQHTLLLRGVEIAGRPSVIGALFQDHDLFGGKLEALFRRIELGPILMQLVAAMLGDEKASRSVEVETLAVPDAGGIAFFGRENLIRLVCVVAPDSRARLELGAGVVARRVRHAVLHFARIRGRSHGHEQVALGVDGKGMHRVIAGDRHAT